jgi:hypothetical protein
MSVKYIKELTEYQKAQIVPWAKKWIKRGLYTEPANREDFETGCKRCYELSGLEWHNNIVWVDNPVISTITGTLSSYIIDKISTKPVSIESVDNAQKCIDKMIGIVFDDILNLTSEINEEEKKGIKIATSQAISNVIKMYIGSYSGRTEDETIENMVNEVDILANKTEALARWYNYIGGTSWLAWQAYESFFDEVCHLEHDKLEEARAYRLAQQNVGHWWPHTDFVIASETPRDIRVITDNQQPILHCEDGPSIKYINRTFWHINQIRVDEQIVMRPETQTIEQIDEEKNNDVRSIRIQRFGWVRYIEESNAELLDSRQDDIEGTHEALYKTKYGKRIVCNCPTGGTHAPGVPDSVNTCVEAQLWLAGENPFRVLGRT